MPICLAVEIIFILFILLVENYVYFTIKFSLIIIENFSFFLLLSFLFQLFLLKYISSTNPTLKLNN